MRSVAPIAVMVTLLMVASSPSPGQEPRRDPPRRPMPPPPVRSPEVQGDSRVTFRFRAPNAKEVLVARDGAARSAMQKDDQGVWSLTTDPLPPDIYPYSFVVDGTTLADPSNPLVKPIVMGGN